MTQGPNSPEGEPRGRKPYKLISLDDAKRIARGRTPSDDSNIRFEPVVPGGPYHGKPAKADDDPGDNPMTFTPLGDAQQLVARAEAPRPAPEVAGYFGQLQKIHQELADRFPHMPKLVNTIAFLDDGSVRVQYNARVRRLGGSTPQLIYSNLHDVHAKDSNLTGVRAWYYGELYILTLKPSGEMKLDQWDPQDAKWKPREANRDTLEEAISSKRTELSKLKLMQGSMQRSGGNPPTSQRPR